MHTADEEGDPFPLHSEEQEQEEEEEAGEWIHWWWIHMKVILCLTSYSISKS